MNRFTVIATLALAAFLEAGGDALMRNGIYAQALRSRVTFLAAGALVLFVYGCIVNAPPWHFGNLIGLYVVFFFLAAQLISWIFFHQTPSPVVLAGGVLIVAGGFVIAAFKN